jgi:tetrahydromethanopterin S-methyltransferase subunit A
VATVLFDIGNDPFPSGDWPVFRNGVQIGAFDSKAAAIACAVHEATRIAMQDGAVTASIHIEGADGVWRVFDASMSAPLA